MIRGWFVDTSVLLLAAGGEHAQRPPCRAFLTAAAASQTPLHASTEAIQEYLFHGLRVSDRESAIAQSRALVGVLHLHDLTVAVLLRAIQLVEATPLRGRGAVHAATALEVGFDAIVTLDSDFALVPGLRALHPSEAL